MRRTYEGLRESTINAALSNTRLESLFRSFWGIVLEFFILYAAVILVFLFVVQIQYDFLTMNLHPLFIIACLIGIRHGFIAGLLAALLSSMVYFFSYAYLQLDPILFFNNYEYYKFPLIFTLGGYLSGRFYDSNARRVKEMQDANEEILGEYDQLEETYRKTVKMYNELKEQIVGEEYSIFSLYDIASSLQTTNPEKVYTESIGLLYKFIKARAISIYTVEKGGYLRLKLHFGSKKRRGSSRPYSEQPIYKKVIEQRVAVRWEQSAGNDAPIFSAPIISEGKVIGIIDIDDLEFEYVTEYSFSIFKVICDWITKALSQAIQIDRQFNLMGVDYSNMLEKPQFDRQLQEENVRKQKYGLPFCSATYHLGRRDPDEIVPIIQRSLRNVDYVCYERKTNSVHVLLPATDEENYGVVERRISSSLGFPLERTA